jgi:hypothetical protein
LDWDRRAPEVNILKIHHKYITKFVARLLHNCITRYEPLRSPLPPLNQSSYTIFSFHDWPSLPHPASYFFVAMTSGSSQFPLHYNLLGLTDQLESLAIRRLLQISPGCLQWPRHVPRAISYLPRGLASDPHPYCLSTNTSKSSTGVPV